MAVDTKVTTRTTYQMEKALYSNQMATNNRDTLKTVKGMAMVLHSTTMEIDMKENKRIILRMEREFY